MAKYRITTNDDSPSTVNPFLKRLEHRGIEHEVVEQSDTEAVVETEHDLVNDFRARVTIELVK